MKVGDYVRTEDWGIIKIKNYYYDGAFICIIDENENEYTFNKGMIDENKSSPNIIDLIEVGDYVNGYKVVGIEKEEEHEDSILILDMSEEMHSYKETSISQDYKIKSILTKEQFKKMEYRLGEDK